MNNEQEIPPCPECGGLRGGHSNRRCSLMTLEYAQQEIINVEQMWIGRWVQFMKQDQQHHSRLDKKVTALQGKVAVLKHENNQLRKQNYRFKFPLEKSKS